VLQLQNNHIGDLPPGIFHDLTNLTQLVLTGNAIVRISPGLFSK
jgi:Leucine-rich repeat (LRR) protein